MEEERVLVWSWGFWEKIAVGGLGVWCVGSTLMAAAVRWSGYLTYSECGRDGLGQDGPQCMFFV